jgi:hypothetical protein
VSYVHVEQTPQDPPGGREPEPEVVGGAEDPEATGADPVRNAAADVERLLSQAPGLKRIVALAERVTGEPPRE